MSDPLTTGSERLAADIEAGNVSRILTTAHIIKADPGIVALVAYAEKWAEDTRLQGLVQEDARVALKTWETGE